MRVKIGFVAASLFLATQSWVYPASAAQSATTTGAKKAGAATAEGTETAAKATTKTAKKAGAATAEGTETAAKATTKTAKKAGTATAKGTKKAGEATAEGAEKAGKATAKGVKALEKDVTGKGKDDKGSKDQAKKNP